MFGLLELLVLMVVGLIVLIFCGVVVFLVLRSRKTKKA